MVNQSSSWETLHVPSRVEDGTGYKLAWPRRTEERRGENWRGEEKTGEKRDFGITLQRSGWTPMEREEGEEEIAERLGLSLSASY